MKTLMRLVFGTISLLASTQSLAQDQFAEVQISANPLKGSAYMLQGAGGNIGVSAGDDGVLIIDDQFAPLAPKISAALGNIASDAPSYVINTHYHGDHTGSNAFFHEHKGATIFAHENVRIRLASDESVAKAALPVVTFDEGIKIHFNGDLLKVFHLANGHTDGDSVVWFENANVLHTGDLFFNERFPYIDLGSGGTVDGYIQAVGTLLSKIDDETQIIPGHGPLANKADYENFLAMIKATRAWVNEQKAAGLTADQAVEKGLPEQYAKWNWSFITEEKWIKTLYQ